MSTENITNSDATMGFEKSPDAGSFEEVDHINEAITKKESDLIAGKYELQEVIGQGGMGKIYRATQLKLNRTVAIKVMLAPDDSTATQRFEAEASVTANLTHPNTVRILDFGVTEDGFLYLVMEYLDGIDIKNYLKRKGAFPPLLAAKLVSEVCGSLAEAHRKEIIHRDIKPGNIMLVECPEEGLRSKLLDFGLVKSLEGSSSRTRTGVILGSPMYMSPEQIDGQQLGAASDLYSLGLTLYNMLTNSRPFRESNLSGILAAQLFKTPTPVQEVNPSLSEYASLLWIVNTAIEKKSENRFRSASQMKRALDSFLASPTATLSLIDGTLHQDGQPIDDVTVFHGTSLQGSVLASQTPDSSVETQTLYQAPTEQTSSKNTPVILMLGLIGLVLIGIAYGFLQQPAPPVESTVVAPTAPEKNSVAAEIVGEKPTSPAISIPKVTLNTIPSGATVLKEDGEPLSLTPFTLQVKEEMRLTFTLDGYEDQVITVNGDLSERTIKLNAKPKPNKKKNTAAKFPKSSSSKNTNTNKKTNDKKFEKKVTNPFDKKK